MIDTGTMEDTKKQQHRRHTTTSSSMGLESKKNNKATSQASTAVSSSYYPTSSSSYANGDDFCHKTAGSSKDHSIAVTATERSARTAHLSSGDNFYDDGYNETELEAELPAKLFFQNTPSSSSSDHRRAFFGREKELQELHQAYNAIIKRSTRSVAKEADAAAAAADADKEQTVPMAPQRESPSSQSIPAVFIWGISGTGKSKLVDAFVQDLETKENTDGTPSLYAIHGKNDESSGTQDPFSALVQAINDWCRQLVKLNDPEELDRLRNRLKEAGFALQSGDNDNDTTTTNSSSARRSNDDADQARILLALVPVLAVLFHPSGSSTTDSASPSGGTMNAAPKQVSSLGTDTAWNRFQYAFGRFLKAIATEERPIIMVLDDLQWTSQVSVDLLGTLLMDRDLHHFMLIGTIRQEQNPHDEDEVLDLDPDLPLAKTLELVFNSSPMSSSQSAINSNATGEAKVEVEAEYSSSPFNSNTVPWTDIHISNLSHQQLGYWLCEVLDRETPEEVESLTTKLHRQTQGNIFFAVQLLQELQRSNMLVYSRICFQWEWNWPDGDSMNDDDDLYLRDGGGGAGGGNRSARGKGQGSRPRFADSVLQLVTSKIQHLPRPLRRALVVAAYIRFTFDLDVLQAVLDNEDRFGERDILIGDHTCATTINSSVNGISNSNNDNGDDDDDGAQDIRPLSAWLEQAVLEGLLSNSIGGTTYRFAHDRIQQAAHGLVPFGETRAKLRLRIGKCLLDLYQIGIDKHIDNASAENGAAGMAVASESAMAKVAQDSGLLFVAADHLNSMPTKDHLFAVKMNVEVGEKALSMTALAPAATYLQLASNALRKVRSPWEEQYEMTLRLIRARGDIELALGHFELGYELGQEVLSRAKTVDDKLLTYQSMAKALGRQDRHIESLALSRTGVQLLQRYPKRAYAFHVAKQLLWVRAYFGKHTDEEFLELPAKSNPDDVLAMKFMTEMTKRGFLSQNILEWMLAFLCQIRLSIRTGLCEDTGMAITNLAVFQMISNDTKRANRFNLLSKKILDRMKGKASEGHVYFLNALTIDSWDKPLAPIAQSYRRAHGSAMETGDFESGFLSWYCCLLHAYHEGYPLACLIADADSLYAQKKLYNVDAHTKMNREHTDSWNMMFGSMPIDWEYLGNIEHYKDKDPFYRDAVYWARLHVAIYFFNFELAEKFWIHNAKYGADPFEYCAATTQPTLHGLMGAGRYRQTGQTKFLKVLRTAKRTIKKLCKVKGNNAFHRYLLLRAEWRSLSGDHSDDDIQSAYDEAIKMAGDKSRLHEAALSCELAGECFLARGKNRIVVVEYFTKAMEYYDIWGGHAKVIDLRNRRGEYIDEHAVKEAREMRALFVPGDRDGNNSYDDGADTLRPADHDLISAYTPAPTRMLPSVAASKDSVSGGGSPFDGEKEEDDLSVLTDS